MSAAEFFVLMNRCGYEQVIKSKTRQIKTLIISQETLLDVIYN